jgi:AraC family transcriptional regulator
MLAPWQEAKAKDMMTGRLAGSIEIIEVARACGMSKSRFVRTFTNTVGVAPYAWFLIQKIRFAKQLLAKLDLSIVQIALECGFVDQSHFTNTFVRRVGMTPYRWRRDFASAADCQAQQCSLNDIRVSHRCANCVTW